MSPCDVAEPAGAVAEVVPVPNTRRGPEGVGVGSAPPDPPSPGPSVAHDARAALWLGALAVVAYFPLLLVEAADIWRRPHYQFFPLVLLGAAYLGRRDASRLGPLAPGDRRTARAAVGVTWGLLGAAVLLMSPWLGTVAALAAVPAVAYAWGGRRLVAALLPAWSLLWVCVPPPGDLDERLTRAMQGVATRWSSAALDVLRVPHVPSGHVIEVAHRRLLVEEACSGVHSLFVVLAGTLFLAVLLRRRAAHGAALVAASLLWVVAGNAARIVAVVWAFDRTGVDLLAGWAHEAVGLAVTALTLALIGSTDAVGLKAAAWVRGRSAAVAEWVRLARRRDPVDFWYESAAGGAEPVGPVDAPDVPPRAATDPGPTRLPALGRTALLGVPTVAAVGGMALIQVACLWQSVAAVLTERNPLSERLQAALAPDTLPARRGDMVFKGFRRQHRDRSHSMGEFSRSWDYAFGPHLVTLSVDFPFRGWHDLPNCYRSQGWSVQARTDAAGRSVEAELSTPTDRVAFLAFRVFDDRGDPLAPPNSGGADSAAASLARRAAVWGRAPWRHFRQSYLSGYTGQVQVLVESPRPLTEPELAEVRAFLDGATGAVRNRLTAARTGGGPSS